VGGFVVTDRMLQMFVRKKPKKVTAGSTDATGATGDAA
jgi:NAD/NADP transhydrogenase alpha subunit